MTSAALSLLEEIDRMRASLHRDPLRLAQLRRLQEWQVQRLERTYTDFAMHPRYRDGVAFFVRDLCGPHDFTRRDRALGKVLYRWERVLPMRAIAAVHGALELQTLTQSLDLAVLEALNGAAPSETTYAEAYRKANRRSDRHRQIWLILTAGRTLDELVRAPAVGMALRLARIPARLAGVTMLHEFLERGYAAFAKMQQAQELLRAIEQRETAIVQRLFAGSPNPFAFGQYSPRAETS